MPSFQDVVRSNVLKATITALKYTKRITSLCVYCVYMALISILVSGKLYAAWYESTGSAKIIQGQLEKARKKAVEEAVKEALLFSGASVTSTQQVTNGLLTKDMFLVRSTGVVNEIETVNEQIEGDRIKVTIRADIFAEERQCSATHYKKSLAVINFDIKHPSQAQIGNLYNLGHLVSQNLYQALNTQAQGINVRQYSPKLIQANMAQNSIIPKLDFKTITEIARQSDAQYILSGSITDISMGETNRNLSSWFNASEQQRYFEMALQLHDGYSGEMLHQFNYQKQANWVFKPREKVNSNSRAFWQSEYGQTIENTITEAMGEIENITSCMASKAFIVDSNQSMIRLNLGRQNGIQIGDKFKILHQSHFTDQAGINRPHFIISPYRVVVSHVYKDSAIASAENNAYLGNVQIGDFLQPDMH